MNHLVTEDLAKPTSLQPIDTPSGLAKPTPMWLIQRPCLTKDYCRCTTTRFDEPSWFYLMPQRTSSRMRLLRLLRISPRLFLDNLRIANLHTCPPPPAEPIPAKLNPMEVHERYTFLRYGHRIIWLLKIWQSQHPCNQLIPHLAWQSRHQCGSSNDHISQKITAHAQRLDSIDPHKRI